MSLLPKGAIEMVSPAQSKSGFYIRYFLIPKKDGGLRPIFDFRHLNRALMKRPFKIITLNPILSQICPGDWFFSLDLRDAYFLIQIAPHKQFLRFAFEGVAYQYTALPFELSLAPRTFTKCMYVALPAETAGNPHPELPWRLAHFGPVWGWASISQIRAPQPLRVPRTQGQLCQERASQRTSFLGTVIDLARMRASHARRCTGSQLHSNSESLALSKHFREFWASWPLRLRYFSWACFTCGPFSTAWNLEFLYTLGYTDTLRCSSGPLEEQSVDRTWRVPGHGLQK